MNECPDKFVRFLISQRGNGFRVTIETKRMCDFCVRLSKETTQKVQKLPSELWNDFVRLWEWSEMQNMSAAWFNTAGMTLQIQPFQFCALRRRRVLKLTHPIVQLLNLEWQSNTLDRFQKLLRCLRRRHFKVTSARCGCAVSWKRWEA